MALSERPTFATQLRLLRMFCSLPPVVEVIAKPHPHDSLLVSALTQLPEFKRVRVEGRFFEDTLNDADLFVLDFPFTVLLNSIATEAFIYLLVEEGVAEFTKSQRDCLEKRVWIFDQAEALEEMIRQSVSCVPPPRLDDTYLLRYGIESRDGNSSRRAVDALLEVSKARTSS